VPESPRIRAPELSGGGEWFNVASPLSLKSLRGKVVLLDFWTYGCVNCMHILPDLKRFEEQFGDALVIVGVHSAKFTNERKPDNIRRIIVRYEIDHPVVNDAAFEIWKAYGARAWPTQVLIDPEGYVVATASGEGKADAFERAIMAVIQVFDERGLIDRTPMPLSPEKERIKTSTLAFPGKVLADEASGRLFIADSNHNRILETTLDGRVTRVFGEGDDWFFRPQGLALDPVDSARLYVADTEHHQVQSIDLASGRIERLAGTGERAAWGGLGGAARETRLNSPWDLVLRDRLLFVAMAGTHQIWMVDLDRQLALPYAGSGREARVDGPADEAGFAQPSGLALSESTLFVADAESNIIRAIDLPPKNQVRTLAGGDLFEFGDKDGFGDTVRLQHPLGLARSGNRVYIADTYNHRIKVLDPVKRTVFAFAGSGDAGHADGRAGIAQFYEPGGLSATSDSLYVADTNNHAIRKVRIADGHVSTITIRES
jgi:DNA-binding beta-propeller fold protein YncE